jgi:hypothetical protein
MLCWGPNRVEAAKIDHDDDASKIDPASYKTWSEYLLAGPSVWAAVAHPPLNPEIEAAMWKSIKTDPPPDTSAVVNFFLWKQSVDPKRFDHYHPNVAKALGKIEAQILTPPTTTTPATTNTSTSPTDQAQQLTPGTTTTTPSTTTSSSITPEHIPEPATLLLTIAMTGYAIWWRRRQ